MNLRVFQSLNVGLSVPYGRAVNPVTGTNWEGVGVEPDLKIPTERALLVARTEALKELIRKTKDESKKGKLVWLLDGLAAEMNPVAQSDSVARACAGTYGPR